MRLPYVDESHLPDATPSDLTILADTKARRKGPLLALDRALLHSPPILSGWNAFFGAIRTGTTIDASLREMIMCRIAVLNRAWFEWEQHEPLLSETGVLRPELVERLRDEGWDGQGLADERHVLVLRYTDAMTRDVVVSQALFERLKALFTEREVVEITATVAGYNAVSRFLVALDVGETAERYGVDMS
jgi:alkylhydroperoxidase family enzyme